MQESHRVGNEESLGRRGSSSDFSALAVLSANLIWMLPVSSSPDDKSATLLLNSKVVQCSSRLTSKLYRSFEVNSPAYAP
jgi:hypothetical protein